MSSRVESVQTPEGSFDLTVWLPAGGTGPGLLLIQEIFGVSDYIQAVAGDLAGLGYVVAAPDLFWRIKPGHQAGHDEAGLAESLELGSQFDAAKGVADATAALRCLSALPEVDGGTGIIGFCLGGSIAYLVAAQAELDEAAAGLGAVVSFYGSPIPPQLGPDGPGQQPAAAPLRRQRPVHPARAGHPGGGGRSRPPERGDARRGGGRARLPQPDGAHVPRGGAGRTGLAADRGVPGAAPAHQGEDFIQILNAAAGHGSGPGGPPGPGWAPGAMARS